MRHTQTAVGDAVPVRRRRISKLPLLAVVLLSLAPPRLEAQPDPAESNDAFFFETVEVNVVNLEVFVTDKKGNPITDLGPQDFEVRAGGKPVEITNFYTAASEQPYQPPQPEAAVGPAGVVPLPKPPEQRLNLVIYIDNLNIRPANRNGVFEDLRTFVNRNLRQGDRVMLVTFDGELELRHAFASLPQVLMPSIDEIEKDAGRGGEIDADLYFVLDELAEMTLQGSGPVGGRADPEAQAAQALEAVRVFAQKATQRTQQSIRGVGRLVEQLAGLEGRKAVLYVSDGLHLRPADALIRAWQSRFERFSSEARGVSAQAEVLDYDLTPEFQRLGRLANAQGVVIHTLDASRYRGTGSVAADTLSRRAQGLWSAEFDNLQTASLQESLRIMAETTGGRALLRIQDVERALADLARDLDTYYSLGFSPPPDDKGYKKVEVKVRRKGLRVRHRGGYEVKSAEQRVAERAVAAALYKQDENLLGVALEAGRDQRLEDGSFEVPVIVKVPLGKLVLIPQPEVHQGKVSLYMVARDAKGRVSPVRTVSFPVRVPNSDLFTALGQHVSYTFKLRLRGGQQTVAVGVRDEVAAVTSLTTLDLVVPGDES